MKQIQPLPTGWAYKYEVAYNQLFDAEPHWRQEAILEEPLGRHSSELAHQAVILAEHGQILKMNRNLGDMKFDPKYMLNKDVQTSGQK